MAPMNICCFQRKLSACVKPLTSRIKVTLLAPKGGSGALHRPGWEHSFAGWTTAVHWVSCYGLFITPRESKCGNLQQEGSGLDKQTQLKPEELQGPGAFLLGERQVEGLAYSLESFTLEIGSWHCKWCAPSVLNFFHCEMEITWKGLLVAVILVKYSKLNACVYPQNLTKMRVKKRRNGRSNHWRWKPSGTCL